MEPSLTRSQIDAMRDEASRIPTEDRRRVATYFRVFTEARHAGYYDRMVEVAPFARRTVTDEDYRVCLMCARDAGDLPSVVACRRALGQKLDREDVWAFRGKPGKATPQDIYDLFARCVQLDTLSPVDQLLFRAFEMQVLGTDL